MAEHTLMREGAVTAQREINPDFDRLLQRTFSPREVLDSDNLDKMVLVAEQLANSRISVPEHLRGNVGDCLAIVTQAMLWNMNPFAVAQKTHLVSGRLGYEAQLVNAVLQNSGAVRGFPNYDYRGDGATLECRVGFVPRGESDILWGEWVRSSDITVKNSPLWKTNPKQQLGYLQVKNWARAFCPGAILGVYTVDELEDAGLGTPRVQHLGVTTPASAAPAPAPSSAPPAAATTATALPTYDQARFDQTIGDWNRLIQSGRKTAQQVIDSLSTKATLTDEQKKRLLDLEAPTGTEGGTASSQSEA